MTGVRDVEPLPCEKNSSFSESDGQRRFAEAEKVHAVLDICGKLTAERDLNAILNLISVNGKHLVQADRLSVFLLDRKRNELWSAPTPEIESIRLDAGVGLAGTAIRTGQVLNVRDAYRDGRFYANVDLNSGYRTRSVLALPLKDPSGRVIGVCEALNKKEGAFTEEDEKILQLLSPQAANVIETAKLIRRLQSRQPTEADAVPVSGDKTIHGPSILGRSRAFSEVLDLARRYAPHDVTVLITGETGTGKEMLARYIHQHSPRSDRPFVACNLASVPESLLESELFGYVRGSFTGAQRDKKGLLEEAEGGTLFLDEIGDIPHNMQVKLLRFLETREYHRIGEPLPRPANVRVLAATNREIDEGITDGSFRIDLFYRLNQARLILPPLRERCDDILVLADHFVARICDRIGKPRCEIGRSLQSVLSGYPWPGNIRELRNVMENAVLLSRDGNLEITDLPPQLRQDAVTNRIENGCKVQQSINQTERRLIQTTLAEMKGDRSKTADLLGISTRTLYRKMRKFGLN